MPGKRRQLDARAADREIAEKLGQGWRPDLWHRVVVQHLLDAATAARKTEGLSVSAVYAVYAAVLIELPPLAPRASVSIARIVARTDLARRTVVAAFGALESVGAFVCERAPGKNIVVTLPHFTGSEGGAARVPTREEVVQPGYPPAPAERSGGAARVPTPPAVAAPPNAYRKPTQPETLPTPAPELITPPNPPHRERDLKHAFEVSSGEQEPEPSVPPTSNDVAGVHPVVSQMLLHLGVRGSTLARYAVAIGGLPRVAPVDVGPWIEAGKARGISSPDEWERWISAALRRRVLTPTQDPRNP
ncbi:MAG: hypothetical protein EKK55_00935 [Rhodocyclaceae bacterium]|nr:MAG: hypothetical protein EKK55_00935 [Rhodocyclaceae bacterium]